MSRTILKIFSCISIILIIIAIIINRNLPISTINKNTTNTSSKNIPKIKSINLYTKGSKKELTKDDYSNINQLITNKLESVNGDLRSVMSEDEINILKEKSNLLEIITNEEENFSYKDDGNNSYKVTYNKLFILLNDDVKFFSKGSHVIITFNSSNNIFEVLNSKEDSTNLSKILLNKG